MVPGRPREPLPDPDDEAGVFEYAMAFDAYERCGSFEGAAAIAKAAPRSTLEEIRIELFFEARASRHRGDSRYLALYRKLRPLIASCLERDAP